MHLKSQKAYPKKKSKEQSLFFEFFTLDIKNIACVGLNVIEYFEKKQGNAPWFKIVHRKLNELG